MMSFFLSALVLVLGIGKYNTTGGQLILTGSAMNATAYVTNGFRMPVFDKNMSSEGATDDHAHVYNPPNANFPFLGDWIVVRVPIAGEGLFSIGDMFIILGILDIAWNQFF